MPASHEVPGLEAHMGYLAEQDCASARDLGYALLAMELAIADAQLDYDRDRNAIGMVQVFEAPGVERTVSELFQLFAAGPPIDGPPHVYDLLAQRFYNMQPFLYVHLAGKALGLRGFCTSVHNACSSGAFALETAAQCIRAGQADVMIVAGGEAFDTAVRLEWFRRLDLYARMVPMRPFEPGPTGFYVGEGAGAIVLESAAHARQRGVRSYAAYLGGAFAHQGWKQTIPDVRAGRLRKVIAGALVRTGVSLSELDLVVPHGAATAVSDKYEAACLAGAFEGQKTPAVAAVFKPQFGHMLASCGIIETIAAVLAMRQQTLPGGPNEAHEQSVLPIPLFTEQTSRPIRTMLKLATGFTGHDAALVFRKVD